MEKFGKKGGKGDNEVMARYYKTRWHLIAYFTTLVVAVGLLITSFIIPPRGQIDPTVLQAVAILLGYYLVFDFPHVLMSLKTFKLSKGDVSVEGETRTKDTGDEVAHD